MTTSLSEAVLSVQEELGRVLNGPLRTHAIHGREGNLLVVQVRSEIGHNRSRRAALRTLGLHGRGSVVLRSDDAATLGNLRKVEDLVITVRLPQRCTRDEAFYGEKHSSTEYQKLQYGTMTRPAELIRSEDGEYLAFESDRNGVLMMWGTRLDAATVFDHCLQVVEGPTPAGEGSVVVVGGGVSNAEGSHSTQGLFMSASEALAVIHERSDVSLARIEFAGLECAWLSPRRPFDDMNTVSAEVQCYTEEIDLEAAKRLALLTGPTQLLAEAQVTVDVRRHGTRRLIPFSS